MFVSCVLRVAQMALSNRAISPRLSDFVATKPRPLPTRCFIIFVCLATSFANKILNHFRATSSTAVALRPLLSESFFKNQKFSLVQC